MKSIVDAYEFLAIIAALGLIFLVLDYLGVGINRIYVVIPFLIFWIVGKAYLRKRNSGE